MSKRYNLYIRDAFGDIADNELHFVFSSINEVFDFISITEKSATESYVYELKRED